MHIKEIIINHYKSIKDPIHLRDFYGFHILVGPNNAGKTNVLDAINIFFDKNLEEERFFDKDADIKMTVLLQNKKITLTCKNGLLADNSSVDLSCFFIRIN